VVEEAGLPGENRILVFSLCVVIITRLVISTSRTVGSAKKFVRITSGFGGGEFTKTLKQSSGIKQST
jgi:hypothetical protein